MQFLTALLAFAAIMALMSTIVAVVIEAIISMLGMRTGGLRRLLEGYYREAVVPRLPEGCELSGTGSEARAFASDLIANPSRRQGLGAFGPRRFNHLTTRQLVEQFSRTEAGGAFLALDDSQLRPHLEALAYEFDRYSDGARDFFSRRTRNFSVIIALVLAFALNIDAIRLYRVLATDQETRETVIALAQERDAQGGTALGVVSTGEGVSADQVDQLLSTLASLSIPIGYSQYPFCSPYSPLLGQVEEDDVVFDQRCERVNDYVDAPEDVAAGGASPLVSETAQKVGFLEATFKDTVGDSLGENALRKFDARFDGDTVLWFFSVLVAGGMIGLGAPFWFNVYRRLGLLIPLVGVASTLASRARPQPTQGGEIAPTTPAPGRRDDANARTDLVVAARTAAGQSPDVPPPPAAGGAAVTAASAATVAPAPNVTGHSPPGAAIGAGSAQRVAAAAAAAGDAGAEPAFRMRRLRG